MADNNSRLDKLKDFAKNVFTVSAANTLVTTAVVAVFLVVVAIYLYRILSARFKSQKSYVLSSTESPILLTRSTTSLDSPKIPGLEDNGQRMSLSFWIYIHNLNSSQNYRYVLARSSDANAISASSPLIFMDKDMPNKMYVRFTKKGEESSSMTKVKPYLGESIENDISGDVPHGISIDYLPIQRWVHVCVVVNELVNGGTITAYVDGEQVKQHTQVGTNFNLNNNGIVSFGHSEVQHQLEGLISRVGFYNYDLNTTDVYAIYRSGPFSSLLSKVGLGRVGLRSPIYRLPA